MNRKNKTVMALVLALLMVVGIIPLDFTHARVQAANKVYEDTLGEYKIEENYNYGKVLVPKADGKYPVMIYVHGSGGVGQGAIPTPWTNLSALMDKWVSAGYVDPMIVVMPKVNKWPWDGANGENSFGYYVAKKDKDGNVTSSCLMDLVNYLKDDTDVKDKPWKAKIDKSQISTIAGYSMGGAASLYAGVMFSDIFKNVGGFSPAWNFYMNAQDAQGLTYQPYVSNKDDLVFSNDNNARLMMSYGQTERHTSNGLGAGENIEETFLPAIRSNKNNQNEFQIYVAPEYINGERLTHSWPLFARETFCFLYYMKFNEQPSAELIELAVDPNKTLPVLPNNNVLTGTVTINNSAIYGYCLSAVVSDCNCSDLSFQWYRGDVAISNATQKDYMVREEDIDRTLSCVVTDKTGKLTGSIKAVTDKVQKAYGSKAPTGITSTPCTQGKTNGTIQNVTDKMEYSANSNFNPAVPCTGTEITDLAAGTYYVRVAETATKKPSEMAEIRVSGAVSDLQISKKRLKLQDTIAIDFIVSKTELDGKYHDPYLAVTQNGIMRILKEYGESGDSLVFTYRVTPQMLGDAVIAVPHAMNASGGDVAGEALKYSVTEYCYNMLSKDEYQGEKYATLRRLLVDILRYGDAAQTYKGYKTGELASRNLTSAQKAMGTDVNAAQTYNTVRKSDYKTVSSADELAKIEAATLFLEAAVNIRFGISVDNTADASDLRVVITDNAECTNVIAEYQLNAQQVSGGLYCVDVNKLNAGQMKKTIYATVKKGNKAVSNTYRYSIESYVNSKRTDSGTNLDKLLDAMMRYGNSAADFVAGK